MLIQKKLKKSDIELEFSGCIATFGNDLIL